MNEPRMPAEPSMDEILASIRRIISEDGEPEAPATVSSASVEAETSTLVTPPERDLDFDLPSILRPAQQPPAAEKPALLGRLADALRGNGSPSRSLEDDLADLLEDAPARSMDRSPNQPSAAAGPDVGVPNAMEPQTRQLLASLDHSLAVLNEAAGRPARSVAPGPAAPAANDLSEAHAGETVAVTDEEPRRVSVSPYSFPALKRAAAAASDHPVKSADPAASKPTGIATMPVQPTLLAQGSRTERAPAFPSQPDAAPGARPVAAVQALAEKASIADPETVSTALNAVTAGVAAFRDHHSRTRVAGAKGNGETGNALVQVSGGSQAATAADAHARLSPSANRTLDDAVTELLRPMLRQWLDENMPRIVEAALRTELAEMTPTKIANGKRN